MYILSRTLALSKLHPHLRPQLLVILPVKMAKATTSKPQKAPATTRKGPMKTEKTAGQRRAAPRTKQTSKRKRAVVSDSESSSDSDGNKPSAPRKKATSRASSEHDLERDGLTIVDGDKSGDERGTIAEGRDTKIIEINSDDELGASVNQH